MAKPIQGTKQADLHLMGTDGDDAIQGKDGNDIITGGHGNDNIDGGDGIDTAVYSGNIADYSIDIKGTGNDKVTVSDHVSGRDGVDQLKHIELLQFNDGVVDLQHGTSWHYLVDAELDVSARKPGTHEMINGSGIEDTHFGLARN
jgi:Ca2+-binding RTX toxin-like protein